MEAKHWTKCSYIIFNPSVVHLSSPNWQGAPKRVGTILRNRDDMVMDEGTSHGLEQDSKFHGHVGGVEEDKGLRIVLN